MILLMGGTSESAIIAESMAEAGFSVLVSMATEVPFEIPSLSRIESRRGRLNLTQLGELIEQRGITVLVDATHPFAVEAHRTAAQAAEFANIRYIRWRREESDLASVPNLYMCTDHAGASRTASALQKPILLTIGSRNVATYVQAARTEELPVFARVLPCMDSEEACRLAGLDDSEIILGRGPFTTEDTLLLLQSLKIGTLVTKDSGRAGGMPEKLEAATRARCNIVVVSRPKVDAGNVCGTTDELLGLLTRGSGRTS